MRARRLRNVAASVHQRLLNRAHEQQEDFGLVLTWYALERLLYRLSQSAYRERFVLKGALLFQVWHSQLYRPTRDLDLLGRGENSPSHLEQVFQDIGRLVVEEDGLEFLAETVRVVPTQQDQEYTGVRVRVEARLGNARIPLQIDIGFGDAITPGAVEIEYPPLLEFPAPVLRAYPRETVVAEKFQALVLFGMATSRMKDLYDLWILARHFAFEGPTLCRALQATFARRQTALPDTLPLVLSTEFAEDSTKRRQWQAFVRKNRLAGEGTDLGQVLSVLQDFFMPPVRALVAGERFGETWPASGPWRPMGNGP